MNKLARRITAIGMCGILCLSGARMAIAQENNKQEQTTSKKNDTTQSAKQQETSKDETVYVLTGADGSVQKIIVSDWIKNTLGSDKVSDKSDLKDIENVKGNESYTLNNNRMKVWDVQGNDIYYRGNIEKELPVDMTVTYKLDGRRVSAKEIAGKSGQVTVRFDYENHQYKMVEINDQKEKIYVPFAMLTGVMLDNNIFRNVEISNGKLINDGEHTIVVGMAFPGLQENLNLSPDKVEIPDYVEITADVTDFEFGMTVTVATNEVFNELDEAKLESVDGKTGSLGELTDAMMQLMDGSSALYDGLCTLLNKSNELVSGVHQLADGGKEIKDGAYSLDGGAAQLKAGLAELSSGLSTLSSNSSSLNNGAAQVFNTLLSTATTKIQEAGLSVPSLTIGNYAEVLDGVIASLDETAVYNEVLQKVTAAVEGRRPEITERVSAAVREQIVKQVIEAATGMSRTDYEAAIAAGLVSEEQQMAVEAAITEQMASETVQAAIAENVEIQIEQAISENMVSDEVQSQLSMASEGAKTIISLKASLDSYNSFYLGLRSYTNGVDSAASGASSLSSGSAALKDGTEQLKTGAAALYNGVLSLKDGVPALVDGVTQLRDGSKALSDGLKQFNEQGVQKLVDLVDGDLEGIAARVKATIDVSKDYRNFAGIRDDMDGQVKFIYRTDEIRVK